MKFDIMTLAELEALADRFGKAVAVIKEAQALLGKPFKQSGNTLNQQAVEQRTVPVYELTPAEVAQRDHLMRQFNISKLPESIRELENDE
jgi:hypothetical protein